MVAVHMRTDTHCLPTGIRHWGEFSTLQRGLLMSEREMLWHIVHALSLLLGKDFQDGEASYAKSA